MAPPVVETITITMKANGRIGCTHSPPLSQAKYNEVAAKKYKKNKEKYKNSPINTKNHVFVFVFDTVMRRRVIWHNPVLPIVPMQTQSNGTIPTSQPQKSHFYYGQFIIHLLDFYGIGISLSQTDHISFLIFLNHSSGQLGPM